LGVGRGRVLYVSGENKEEGGRPRHAKRIGKGARDIFPGIQKKVGERRRRAGLFESAITFDQKEENTHAHPLCPIAPSGAIYPQGKPGEGEGRGRKGGER